MPRWTRAFGLLALLAASCRADDRVRVACVGDSITFGIGVENLKTEPYPAVLQKLLGDRYEVRNFGISGSTLLKKGEKPYVQEEAFRLAKEFRPNVVVIKLGTNDTKAQNWVHQAEFEADYREFVQEFKALDSKPRVFLCVPVPAYRGNFGIIDEHVRELKRRIERLGKELNLPVIDLYTPLSDHPDWFPDQVHPNPAGARKIAETVHAAIKDHEK